VPTLEAARNHPNYKVPLGPNQAAASPRASVQYRRRVERAVHVNEDGSVAVIEGNPDIGGSRASMAMMAAEVLGISYEKVRPLSATPLRSGSPSSPAAAASPSPPAWPSPRRRKGRDRTEIARRGDLGHQPRAVEWKDGKAFPAGANAAA